LASIAIMAVTAGLLILLYSGAGLGSRPDIRIDISSNITVFGQEYYVAKHMAGDGPTTRWRSGIRVNMDILLRNRKAKMTGLRIDYGIINESSGKKLCGGDRGLSLQAKGTRREDIVFDFVASTTPGATPNPEDYSCRVILVGQSPSGDTWRREFSPPVPGFAVYKA
jgi:hypothetical protein